MRKFTIVLLGLCMAFPLFSQDQDVRSLALSLNETIDMAQGETPDKALREARLITSYWDYQAFQGAFKPQLGINAVLPNYIRAIDPITLPNGTINYVERTFMTNSADLSLSQLFAGTGTRVTASSGLERLDEYFENSENETQYYSNPLSLRIEQPLFNYNPYKWQKQIAPIQYEEAQADFVEEMEDLAYEAVRRFFDLYNAQLNLTSARFDKANTDSLLRISEGRFEVGRIAETDLLQIQLAAQNAESAIAQSNLQVKRATEELRELLGIKEAVEFDLITPPSVPVLVLDKEVALAQARKHRSITLNFRRRLLQAEQQLAQAVKGNGVNVSLQGSFGLSQAGPEIGNAYQELLDQERLSLGVYIPITDWGRTEAARQLARTQLELTQLQIEQEEADFEREILNLIDEYDLIRQSYQIALATYEVAEKKLDITQKRYFVGKIGTLDLNNAISEKETARQRMIQNLREYWLAYYELRVLTLYDFHDNEPITYLLPIE